MNSPVQIWRSHKKLHQYLNKVGKLLVWTKIFIPPAGFEHQAPYIVGIVQFADGERLPMQIVDCQEEDLKPNQSVRTVVRKIGKVRQDEVIEYGIKVKPL